jgi:glycosyltransferase involved in cell wall biosynthesis
MTRVLFHAPLKPADHPEPSGDRTMARLLVRALERAGFEVEIASTLRMFDRDGDAERARELADAALAEAEAKAAEIMRRPAGQRPALMFTYHVYYKAPDVLGPALAGKLGIPYCIAEGSRAPKRARGRWAHGHARAEAALDAAALVLVVNGRDRPALEAARPAGQRLADLPPFIDAGAWRKAPVRAPLRPGRPVSLLAAAMMRDGDKLASYRLLAEALHAIRDLPWTLAIAGDGPARAEIEALFADFGGRVAFLGRLDHAGLEQAYAAADLLVWPAVNEAFGMVFLEAAACGCPALAGQYGGVPDVVREGRTGRVVEGGSAAAFAQGLAGLIGDPAALRTLGSQAEVFARTERDIDGAAAILRRELGRLAATGRKAIA